MATCLVEPSAAVDMIGPYLSARVACPFCKSENILVHIEGPASPVKTVDICTHLRAHVVEDGESKFEFEN